MCRASLLNHCAELAVPLHHIQIAWPAAAAAPNHMVSVTTPSWARSPVRGRRMAAVASMVGAAVASLADA